MPSLMACWISGENLLMSKVWPGPTLILAKRASRALSDGLGGQNWKRKLTKGKIAAAGRHDVRPACGQLTAGAAGGAGWWRNELSGFAVVFGLNLVDLGQVGHVEELGAEEAVGELSLGVQDVLDARGRVARSSRGRRP